jgi:type II secretory pathway predicted ATPase ExeA
MFEAHFALRENPFVAGHQPRFVFPSHEHQEALAHLRFGIQNREPFVLITGEVGTGKTTALYEALGEWQSRAAVGLITNSALTRAELLEEICLKFGLALAPPLTKPQALEQLERHLLALRARDQRAILLLDEAQNLGPDLLEEIRLLSNLEAQGEKLAQVFLIGQPELESKLARPELRQLRQRIGVHYRIRPLGVEDTERYIHHRVSVAGGYAPDIFPHDTCVVVWQLTHGIPREINQLCAQSMLGAFVEDARTVRPEHVHAAAAEARFQSVAELQGGEARGVPATNPEAVPLPAVQAAAPAPTRRELPASPHRPVDAECAPAPQVPAVVPQVEPAPSPPSSARAESAPARETPGPSSFPAAAGFSASSSERAGVGATPTAPGDADATPPPTAPATTSTNWQAWLESLGGRADTQDEAHTGFAESVADAGAAPAAPAHDDLHVAAGAEHAHAPEWSESAPVAPPRSPTIEQPDPRIEPIPLYADAVESRGRGTLAGDDWRPPMWTAGRARTAEPERRNGSGPAVRWFVVALLLAAVTVGGVLTARFTRRPTTAATAEPAATPPAPSEPAPVTTEPHARSSVTAVAPPVTRPVRHATGSAVPRVKPVPDHPAVTDSVRPRAPAAASHATPFAVAVGTYSDRQRADSERDRLAALAPAPVRVVPLKSGEAAMYALLVGSFQTRAAAQDAANDLVSRGVVDEARIVGGSSSRAP